MIRAVTEPELVAAAEALAPQLAPGSVVWLEGPLGAGKTTVARALARARGAGSATSPTFNLAHRYDGPRGPSYHVDCYRLRDPEEAAELDWAGMLAGDLLLIEWPERGGPWVPPPDLRVRLGYDAEPERRTLECDPPDSTHA